MLLYLMQHQQQPVDPGYLANRLMLPQEKALQALDYWVEQGFLTGKEQAQPAQQPEAQTAYRPEPSQQSRVQVGLQAQKRTMAIDEIHTLSQNDASISQLVEAVQAQMGKVLTRSEIETLVSFYTYAGLPPEYILLAAAHCCAKNMPNMRALSKLLTDMMSENIYTYEQAEQYLSRRQQQDTDGEQAGALDELDGVPAAAHVFTPVGPGVGCGDAAAPKALEIGRQGVPLLQFVPGGIVQDIVLQVGHRLAVLILRHNGEQPERAVPHRAEHLAAV